MNQNIFQDGIKHLLTVEPEFKRFVPNHDIDFFLRPDGFAGICALIIEQQISVAAANSIKAKVFLLMNEVCAKDFLNLSDNDLRKAGLSRPKINYLKGVAVKNCRENLILKIWRKWKMSKHKNICAS